MLSEARSTELKITGLISYEHLQFNNGPGIHRLMTVHIESRKQSKKWKRNPWINLTICLLAISSSVHVFGATSEYTMKAAFIEKLTHFVDWPDDSPLADPNHVFTLCVIGKNPFEGSLQKLASQMKIKGRNTLFLEITSPLEVQGCDLLFVSNKHSFPIIDILTVIKNRPVLSVSDTPGFAEQGGMVNFFTEEGRLGFEVNLKKAKTLGFNIRSRLLKLSRIVNEGESGE